MDPWKELIEVFYIFSKAMTLFFRLVSPSRFMVEMKTIFLLSYGALMHKMSAGT